MSAAGRTAPTVPDTSGGRFLKALPFGGMAVVAVIDVLAGPDIGYLPLLSLGPAFASLSCGMRRTAAVGVLALALCGALGVYDHRLGTRQNTLTFVSIAGVIAAGIAAAGIRQRAERELADVRTVAEAAQRVLLRPVPRRIGPVHAAVRYISASARARIGGDLYEIVMTPHGARLIVGDVQGKGLDAVETAAVVLGAFREAAFDEPDLPGVVGRLETALARQLTSEQFVTAIVAEVDGGSRVTLVNCGHPPPLVVRDDGVIEFVEPPDTVPPLGLVADTGTRPEVHETKFSPGDRMLLYTDGVIEARDGERRFYPLADRAPLLDAGTPDDALDRLREDLTRHAGGPLADDAAMLLLQRR
jgi:serine phosphatase RsbU (regulator of sigma subunit)